MFVKSGTNFVACILQTDKLYFFESTSWKSVEAKEWKRIRQVRQVATPFGEPKRKNVNCHFFSNDKIFDLGFL